MPFLPNFAYFSKSGEASGLERAKSGDLWSITPSPALLNVGEEKQFACTSMRQVSEEGIQL